MPKIYPTHTEIEQALKSARDIMYQTKSPAFELSIPLASGEAIETKAVLIRYADSIPDTINAVKQACGIKIDPSREHEDVVTEDNRKSFLVKGTRDLSGIYYRAYEATNAILSLNWVSDATWRIDLRKEQIEIIVLSFDDVTLTVAWHYNMSIRNDHLVADVERRYLKTSPSVMRFESTWRELVRLFGESLSLPAYPSALSRLLMELSYSNKEEDIKAHQELANRIESVLADMLKYLSSNGDMAQKHGVTFRSDNSAHYVIRCYDGREIVRNGIEVLLR